LQHRGLPGLEKLLNELGRRAESVPRDPRQNRNLFFEPWLESQTLDVPQETAELVALRLHQFTVFHLWTRVSCPNVGSDDSAIIVETDSKQELQAALEQSCAYCGHCHNDDPHIWEYTESLYAFNLSDDGSLPRLGVKDLSLAHAEKRPPQGELSSRARCIAILEEPVRPDQSPVALLEASLASNKSPMLLPKPDELWWRAWQPMMWLLLVYPLILGIAYLIAGPVVAGIGAGLYVCALYFAYKMSVQRNLGASLKQKMMLNGGIAIATLCLSSGLVGIRFVGGFGRNRPFDISMEWGNTDWKLVYLGVGVFAFTLLGVWWYDFSIGWLGTAR
jgi:hypothetical protein